LENPFLLIELYGIQEWDRKSCRLLTHRQFGVKFGAMHTINYLKRKNHPHFFGMIFLFFEI